jgi:hypothetical protein
METQVKEAKTYSNKQLKLAYDRLPFDIRSKVREELCQVLFWKPSTFYTRYSSSVPIRKIEKTSIEQVFRKYGVDVFNLPINE